MGFVAQLAFEKNYVHEKMPDGLDSEKGKAFQNSTQFKFWVSQINEGKNLSRLNKAYSVSRVAGA